MKKKLVIDHKTNKAKIISAKYKSKKQSEKNRMLSIETFKYAVGAFFGLSQQEVSLLVEMSSSKNKQGIATYRTEDKRAVIDRISLKPLSKVTKDVRFSQLTKELVEKGMIRKNDLYNFNVFENLLSKNMGELFGTGMRKIKFTVSMNVETGALNSKVKVS